MTLMITDGDRDTVHHRPAAFAPGRLAAALVDGLARRLRTAAARRTLARLSPEQLLDVGLPEVVRRVPAEEARLVASLMSMR